MDDELDQLKTIPILAAAAALGWEVTRPSPGSAYCTARRAGLKIEINSRGGLFFDNSAGRGGSVIDLAGLDTAGNLGRARKLLRPLLGAPPNSFPTARFSSPASASRDAQVAPAPDLLPAGRAARAYLASRGIPAELAEQAIAVGGVGEQARSGFRNTVFVHRDAACGIVGGEVRGPRWKSHAGPKNGLWSFKPGAADPDLILVCESAVDGLSWLALYDYNALAVSTGGTPARAQLAAIRDLVTGHPQADLVAGHDADAAGDAQAAQVLALAPPDRAGRLRPDGGKDWNDQLNAQYARA